MRATRSVGAALGRGAAVAAWALALGGCQSLGGRAAPDAPEWVSRPTGSMELLWSRDLIATARRDNLAYERGQPEIDTIHDRVFVGSSDHGLYALQADDGTMLWRFETIGAVQCAPLYDPREDALYFGSNDGALYKVRASDGALAWRFSTKAEVARRPILSDGLLFVVNANDTVMALDPASGALQWSHHRPPAMGMEIAGYAGVSVFRGKVYAAFSDGNVVAMDARTGEDLWQPVDLSAEAEALLGQVPQYLDVDTTPVAVELEGGPAIFVGAYEGGVFALDADTGVELWSSPGVLGVTDLHYWSQPAHALEGADGVVLPPRHLLVAGTGTSGLWGLDPDTGAEVWRRRLPSTGVTAPVDVAGALLVGASGVGLFLVSPIDGGIMDGVHTGEGLEGKPAGAGVRAFALTNGGRLLALSVRPPKLPDRPRVGFRSVTF